MNKIQLIKEYKEIGNEQYENFKLIEEKSERIKTIVFMFFCVLFSSFSIFLFIGSKENSSTVLIENVSFLSFILGVLSLLYNLYKYKQNKEKYTEAENKKSIYFKNKRIKLMKKIVNNKKMLLEFKNIDEEDEEMFIFLNKFIKERRSKTLIEYIEEIDKKELKNISII